MDNYNLQAITITDNTASKILCNILCVLTSSFEALCSHKQNFLHTQELDFFAKLKHQRRKKSYLQGRYAAKLALTSKHVTVKPHDIFIDAGVFGFPFIAAPNLITNNVSISHSGDFAVAIAYDKAYPMAVDIEQINEQRRAAIESQMLPAELDLVQDIAGLTTLWTAKEALSKVLKCGLDVDFNLLQIKEQHVLDDRAELTFKNFPQYQCIAWRTNNCMLALIAPSNCAISITNI